MSTNKPVTPIRAAVMLKDRVDKIRGPLRLDPGYLHTEIFLIHRDLLHLCELLALEEGR